MSRASGFGSRDVKADAAEKVGAVPFKGRRLALADEVRDVLDKFPGLAFASTLLRVVEELER